MYEHLSNNLYSRWGGGNPVFKVISGDDLAFCVEFEYEDETDTFEFSDDTTCVLLIHLPDGTDETYSPVSYDGEKASFYLSGDDTNSLLKLNPTGKFYFCVRVFFSDGSQNTPIYKKLLLIERC